MDVRLINASSKVNGKTAVALEEVRKEFEKLGLETIMVHIDNKNIHGCIIGYPVYFANVNEYTFQRYLFYSTRFDKAMKFGGTHTAAEIRVLLMSSISTHHWRNAGCVVQLLEHGVWTALRRSERSCGMS